MADLQQDKKNQLSPIIERVVKYAATELAKLQESLSQEAWQYIAFEKRPNVNILMKGDSSFPVASQAFIKEIQNDPDAKLTDDEIVSLKDVFSKTAEAIAKAEKKTEVKKGEEKHEIHTMAEFLSLTMDGEYYNEALKRLTDFVGSLTLAQRQNFATGLKIGDQSEKFYLLARINDTATQVAISQLNGWI